MERNAAKDCSPSRSEILPITRSRLAQCYLPYTRDFGKHIDGVENTKVDLGEPNALSNIFDSEDVLGQVTKAT